MHLVLSMGLRPDGRAPTPLAPRLRVLDPERGALVREVPLEASHPPPDGDQATLPWFDGAHLLQPTRTALWLVDPWRGTAHESWTHPRLHDVHSVAPSERGLWVTATGHEAVLEVVDGAIIGEHVLGTHRPDDRDYRRLAHDALKPHAVHPNHAFTHEGRSWVTCKGLGACVGLGHEGRLDLGEHPHDGVLRQGRRWFTTTGGVVVVTDPAVGEVLERLDVAALEGAPGHFGWCRGIEVVGDRLFVGVTQLRASRWREAARRVVRGPKQPTRVLEVDLSRRRLRAVHPVGNGAGGTLYGITAIRLRPR